MRSTTSKHAPVVPVAKIESINRTAKPANTTDRSRALRAARRRASSAPRIGLKHP